LLDAERITVNKNSVPNDPEKPFVTSGIRIGTPSVTTRGMNEDDMRIIGRCIAKTVREKDAAAEYVKKEVKALCDKYPLYANAANL
jgi:glycine hydroxymethyltransferase